MANEIAATHGVDVIILGNNDLASFSGWSQHDPRYQDAIIKVHDAALKYGRMLWQRRRAIPRRATVSADTRMVQNGPACDGWRPAGRGSRGRLTGRRRDGHWPSGRENPDRPDRASGPAGGRQRELLPWMAKAADQ